MDAMLLDEWRIDRFHAVWRGVLRELLESGYFGFGELSAGMFKLYFDPVANDALKSGSQFR